MNVVVNKIEFTLTDDAGAEFRGAIDLSKPLSAPVDSLSYVEVTGPMQFGSQQVPYVRVCIPTNALNAATVLTPRESGGPHVVLKWMEGAAG